MIVLSLFVLKTLFVMNIRQEEPVIETVQEIKEETVNEEKKEEKKEEKEETVVIEEDKKEDLTAVLQDDDPRQLYKMLDFDRRLILTVGEQDRNVCSIFCLAYARAILDSNDRSDPYAYYDGDGAVWRWAEYEDIASSDPLLTVLQRAYDEIDAGRPTIFFVSGVYAYTAGEVKGSRTSADHYVLLIGYKADADYKALKPSDFYAADPSAGYCCDIETHIPWVVLSDDAPELTSGEYALYASNEPEDHVKTCLAYADTCAWSADLSKPIYPEYRKQ